MRLALVLPLALVSCGQAGPAQRAHPSADVAALVADAPDHFAAVRGEVAETDAYGPDGDRYVESQYTAPLAADSARSATVTVTQRNGAPLYAVYRATFGLGPDEGDDLERRRRNDATRATIAHLVAEALPEWDHEDDSSTSTFRECPNFFGRTVRVDATSSGVVLEVASGTQPCAPPAQRALAEAALVGDLAAARAALDAGADPHGLDERGETPFVHAAGEGNEALVRLFLDRGAAPDGPPIPEALGHASPIRYAASPAVLEMLLEAGADPDLPGPNGLTALHGAVIDGDAERVRLLLAAGADPDARAAPLTDQAPLHLAVLAAPEIVRLLLDAGADPNLGDELGYTPLGIVARAPDDDATGAEVEIGRMLLEAGADPNRASSTEVSYGWTPLMEAARTGHTAFVRFLLGVDGVDLAARNTEGETALGAARANGWDEAVALLEAAGAPE